MKKTFFETTRWEIFIKKGKQTKNEQYYLCDGITKKIKT